MVFENGHTEEAKVIYTAFANKNGLEFFEESNEDGDTFFVFPAQPKLRFELTLGLQNGDEANIGIESFWSYIFPFADNIEFINETLEGLLNGTHCVAEYKQLDRVTKLCLLNEKNEIIYTDIKRIKVPFFGEKMSRTITNKLEK